MLEHENYVDSVSLLNMLQIEDYESGKYVRGYFGKEKSGSWCETFQQDRGNQRNWDTTNEILKIHFF